ncbi:MAG: penicillin-binding protein 2 [Candidatus Omnitrophica bacterium]|nr:penicillin-binding protein 2 [Candidatus Omnitrophota bacterium]
MRLLILQRLFAAAFLFLWGGLWMVQVVGGLKYRRQAEQNRIRLIHLPAARGSILDRKGIPLVEDRIGFEVAAFPQELKNPQETWARLTPIVGIPPSDLNSRYRRGYQAPFFPVPLVRDLPIESALLLEEKRNDIPGAMVRPVPRRRYLLGPALGPVAGYLGLIGQEELTKLRPYGYSFRDFIGKDGLEKQYDAILRGQDGGLQVEVDHRGRMVRELGFLKPRRGRRITTTLDGRLQSFCHRLLEGKAGAILVMDSETGEVLALVSRPTFDPNAFVNPERGLEVRHALGNLERPMFNRALRAAVPPGSTFKAAVAYEALVLKKIQGETAFVCPGFFTLGRAIFHCWRQEGHGPQAVRDALEHSCNVFFYQTGRRLGVDGIIQAARLFGLGRRTGIDLPRESDGFVPDPAWMKAAAKQPWQEGDTISFAIGQGALQTTPLQMLLLYTAIAMDGYVPQPHLLIGIEGDRTPGPRRMTRLALNRGALARVKEGLEQAVNSPTGTGRLAQLPGVKVAGKTGTAQVSRGFPHAWFCGYAPVERPRISLVVFLEHGGKGGDQAAAVAKEVLVALKEMEYL